MSPIREPIRLPKMMKYRPGDRRRQQRLRADAGEAAISRRTMVWNAIQRAEWSCFHPDRFRLPGLSSSTIRTNAPPAGYTGTHTHHFDSLTFQFDKQEFRL